MIAAIVFDLDGVIVDSNQAIFDTYQQTAKMIGEEVPSTEEIRRLLGQPSSTNLKLLFGDNPNARSTYDQVNPKTHANLPFLPHAEEVLIKIQIHKAIVTSKRLDHALEVLRDLKKFFPVIITPEQTTKQKPDPEPLVLACKKLNVRAQDTVYVGDTIRDYETAQNAGAKFIGFVHNGATAEEFYSAGALDIITDLIELPGRLN